MKNYVEKSSEPFSSPSEIQGWILYDASCGFCSRWTQFFRSILRKRGFGIAPLQSEWVKEKIALPEHELLSDLRLLLPTGEYFSGADAYRYALRKIWWAYPFYLFSVAPVTKNIFNWGYRGFADHRHLISRACNLKVPQ